MGASSQVEERRQFRLDRAGKWAAMTAGAWLAPLLVACSGSGDVAVVGTDSAGTDVPRESTTDADEDSRPVLPTTATPADAPELPSNFPGCLSVSWTGRQEAGSYSLWTYDATSRVLVSAPSDDSGTPIDPSDTNQRRTLLWKLDENGRVLVRAGGGGSHRAFRQTTERDAHGNPLAIRAVYLDTDEPSALLDADTDGQTYSESAYINEYDLEGRLNRNTLTAPDGEAGLGTEYGHDAEGRCETLTGLSGEPSEERRDYDSRSRLWHVVRTGVMPLEPNTDEVTLTHAYDGEGRLLSTTEAVNGGTPRAVLRRAYWNDGSILETADPRSDVDSGGAFQTLWSAGCGELRAHIPRMSTQGCVVADGAVAGDNFLF